MELTRAEFEARYTAGNLRIALIGMSNIGKSYTATRLTKHYDMSLIEVDKIIWQQLGQGSMADFADWQGQPYSKDYAAREAKSIELETQATLEALAMQSRNPLLDTTGSVIYTDKTVLETLKSKYFIVHIRASKHAVNMLKKQYFKTPKPLIWRHHYHDVAGKTPTESIQHCYPDLLSSRAKAYAELADHSLESDFILNPDTDTSDVFKALKPAC
ncbi:MAG: hypothetical protein ABJG88_04775 [Litorimonas sp.]